MLHFPSVAEPYAPFGGSPPWRKKKKKEKKKKMCVIKARLPIYLATNFCSRRGQKNRPI
jgi:hypothetical protein